MVHSVRLFHAHRVGRAIIVPVPPGSDRARVPSFLILYLLEVVGFANLIIFKICRLGPEYMGGAKIIIEVRSN